VRVCPSGQAFPPTCPLAENASRPPSTVRLDVLFILSVENLKGSPRQHSDTLSGDAKRGNAIYLRSSSRRLALRLRAGLLGVRSSTSATPIVFTSPSLFAFSLRVSVRSLTSASSHRVLKHVFIKVHITNWCTCTGRRGGGVISAPISPEVIVPLIQQFNH
jgi:hypothetical protein